MNKQAPPARIVPTAPPDAFNINRPSPTPGLTAGSRPTDPAPGRRGGDPAPGFQPRDGESNEAARARVINAKLGIAAANGQTPARNG